MLKLPFVSEVAIEERIHIYCVSVALRSSSQNGKNIKNPYSCIKNKCQKQNIALRCDTCTMTRITIAEEKLLRGRKAMYVTVKCTYNFFGKARTRKIDDK